jgi:hypothetical protein
MDATAKSVPHHPPQPQQQQTSATEFATDGVFRLIQQIYAKTHQHPVVLIKKCIEPRKTVYGFKI